MILQFPISRYRIDLQAAHHEIILAHQFAAGSARWLPEIPSEKQESVYYFAQDRITAANDLFNYVDKRANEKEKLK